MRRATNQDSLAILPTPNGEPILGDTFLMVADGMGAHAAGELASQIATDTIPLSYQKAADEAAASALRRAIRDANQAIHTKGSSSPDFHGMGTTCSCLVLTQGSALVGHVGDSRVYRLREGVLEQLTFDHSLVWEMAAASNVSEDKVPSCIPKNVITRSLGPHETVNVDLEGPHCLQAGDTFLLCSDGLTGVVDDELAGAILSTMEPDAAAQTLVDLANLRGGPDNISVIVAQIESGDATSGPSCAASPARPLGRLRVGISAAVACFIVCVWFVSQGHVTGMLASAVGLGAAVAYAASERSSAKAPAASRPLGGSFGNGPYRRTECGEPAAAAGVMQQIVAELAELSAEQSPDEVLAIESGEPISTGQVIDWAAHQDAQQEANDLLEKGNFAAAIAGYASIVRAVVQGIREDDGTHRYKAGSELLS